MVTWQSNVAIKFCVDIEVNGLFNINMTNIYKYTPFIDLPWDFPMGFSDGILAIHLHRFHGPPGGPGHQARGILAARQGGQGSVGLEPQPSCDGGDACDESQR